MQVSHLAIFGPGLIGGSLALAARQREVCARLSVWSPDAAERRLAEHRGLADVVTEDAAVATVGADLVILCTPPAAMPAVARQIAPYLKRGAVVSDVGSIKGGLAEELTAIFQTVETPTGSRYVGAHPMAGAERHGLPAARADLFAGCVCLLTPLEGRTAPDATESVEAFWQMLGARTQRMSPQAHDEAVAAVSHLPHVLAAALMSYVGRQGGSTLACAGPGWRDMTRLAGGSPEMWTEILSRNRLPVTNALHGMIARLREVLELLEAGRDADLEAFLDEAKSRREAGRRMKDEG